MANVATEGAAAHSTSITDASADPTAMMVAAPSRSICLPM